MKTKPFNNEQAQFNNQPTPQGQKAKKQNSSNSAGAAAAFAGLGGLGGFAAGAFATSEDRIEDMIDSEVEPEQEPIASEEVNNEVEVPVTEAPANNVVVEPIIEPIAEPIAEPTVEPIVEPIAEPVVEPIAEPVLDEPIADVGEISLPEDDVVVEPIDSDDIAEGLLAEEMIDPNDIDAEDVFDFAEIGTVYTIEGDEVVVASFTSDNDEFAMVDLDNDGIMDIIMDETGEVLAQAPDYTTDDIYEQINSEGYIAAEEPHEIDLLADAEFDDMMQQDLIS